MFEAEPTGVRGLQATSAHVEVASDRPRALTPAETAWIVLIPCAIVMLAAIAVVGPPLGHALVRRGSDALWPPDWWQTKGTPEPVKHGRFALALLAPLVLAGAILVGSRRPRQLRARTIRALTLAGQAAVLAVVVVAVLGQRNLILTDQRLTSEWKLTPIFSVGMLVVAAALVTVAAIALRRHRVIAWIGERARERPALRAACLGIAIVFPAVWLIDVVSTDALYEDIGMLNWIPSGAYAVLDGRTTLVDAHILYSKLLPYPTALVLATFGTTTLVFTLFMAVLNLAALLAVYAIFRRIVGSAFALALFLPFVALSDTGYWMRLASIWPMRYGGAYVLAWLTARHIDGRRPRHAWILFFGAGLVAIDDLDFGLGALLASLAALLCGRPPRSARDVWRLAGTVAGGVLGAVAAVTAFTLARAGKPPSLDVLLEWPRIFTDLGLISLPLPRASLHLALYATLVAAIAVAAVRLARGARDVLLTSMLAWSGVFGLIAANYYVARPDDIKLYAMFSAWGFAIALLTIVCVRALTARDWRAPTPAELLVLFAFALSICTIGRIHSPQPHIAQLGRSGHSTYRKLAEPFVARHTHRGEKVAIMMAESYRIAYDLGLDNISPYESENAVVTKRQMGTLIDTIEREGVTTLFTPIPGTNPVGDSEASPRQLQVFHEAGFTVVDSTGTMLAWKRPG
jgi:hypothetical protein